jgi:hypothetical protein
MTWIRGSDIGKWEDKGVKTTYWYSTGARVCVSRKRSLHGIKEDITGGCTCLSTMSTTTLRFLKVLRSEMKTLDSYHALSNESLRSETVHEIVYDFLPDVTVHISSQQGQYRVWMEATTGAADAYRNEISHLAEGITECLNHTRENKNSTSEAHAYKSSLSK